MIYFKKCSVDNHIYFKDWTLIFLFSRCMGQDIKIFMRVTMIIK